MKYMVQGDRLYNDNIYLAYTKQEFMSVIQLYVFTVDKRYTYRNKNIILTRGISFMSLMQNNAKDKLNIMDASALTSLHKVFPLQLRSVELWLLNDDESDELLVGVI
jgi:hypothetical protein